VGGVVYGNVGSQLLYRMWFCPNGSTLSVQSVYYDQIYTDGCEHKGTYNIDVGSDTMSSVLAFAGLTLDAAAIAAGGGFWYPEN
jgi:hypothetical protein